jgi:hypothetical protein
MRMMLLWLEEENKMSPSANEKGLWAGIYKLGGLAALSTILVGVLEIAITFLPGGNTTQETARDWFLLFQTNGFMGLRDLGLLNIFLNVLGILTAFALYTAHRGNRYQPYITLAMILNILGVGIFYATNRAFPMLALSQQYAVATTDAQRAVLEAAGQAMLSVGQSHTPGTFLGFFFTEAAGVAFSIIMLRSKIFSKATAYMGILGFGLLLIFEFLSSFVSGLSAAVMLLAMVAGLSSMAWDILLARKLFQLGRNI